MKPLPKALKDTATVRATNHGGPLRLADPEQGQNCREPLDPLTVPVEPWPGCFSEGPQGSVACLVHSSHVLGHRAKWAADLSSVPAISLLPCFPSSPRQTQVRGLHHLEYLSSGLSTESAVEGILLSVVPSATPHQGATGGTRPCLPVWSPWGPAPGSRQQHFQMASLT